ncbi:MAG: thioredoxin family protein [Acetobacteraceae bacterium]|nr:thioredoxin family protein [Acetobacteraceae bacterium]
MDIRILGASCAKCRQLAANVERAVRDLGLAVEITKVDDVAEMVRYGILAVPAMVVDGEVRSVGRVLTPDQVKRILVSLVGQSRGPAD